MIPFDRRAPSNLSLWGPVVLQMAIICAASSIPNLGALPGHVSDKAAHAFGYAILGAALVRALSGGRWDRVTVARALAAIAIALLYALGDELHQRFVPGRSADLLDVAADLAGASLAVVLGTAAAAVRAWDILGLLQRRRQ